MDKIIECVPNISEGRDKKVITAIASEIKSVAHVKLLHIDSGFDANRTVFTFAGVPDAVFEAAYLMMKKACELIDMRLHSGEHPRLGAVDVCPFVPINGVEMEEVVEKTRGLAKKIGEEFELPVFCYEEAAINSERKALSLIRKGEYEGLEEKLNDPFFQPDYGPARFLPKNGALVIGTRPFLIAYNINLNTKEVSVAKAIASKIRESSINENALAKVRAIGWYIQEYGMVQVSTNILDFEVTSMKTVYEKVEQLAAELGIKTKGSELIGLVPQKALLNSAIEYGFEQYEDWMDKVSGKLGLSSVVTFYPDKKVLEYVLQNETPEVI